MRILDRYVAVRFLAALAFANLVLLSIYVLANLVENLDKFLDAHATMDQVFRYYLNFVPQIIVIMQPIAILLATLFSMGALSKNSELMAMRASGIPLHRTAMPLLVMGFLLSLVSMGLNETIVPNTNQRRWEINEYEIQKKKQDRRQIMYHVYRQGENGRIFRLERYDILANRGFSVMVQKFDKSKLIWTMKAEEMQMVDSVWHFRRGDIRTFIGADSMRLQTFDSLMRPEWTESPQSFAQKRKLPENMGYSELSEWVEFKKRAGTDTTKEMVDLQVKLAFPFACFIMVIIAIPIAASPKRAGFARSFGIAFGIMFFYFTLSRSIYKLGEAGDLPGLVAAWSVNILFLIIGLVLYAFVRK